MFKNKSHDEINNDRAAECEKRKIDKIQSDFGCFDPQLFSPPFTNPESLLFKPGDNAFYHITNIKKATYQAIARTQFRSLNSGYFYNNYQKDELNPGFRQMF